MAWNIHHLAAGGILNTASTDVDEYKGKFTAIDTSLNALRTALPNSTLVRDGITELDTNVVDPARNTVTNRSGSAVSGTRSAVGHYVLGHYDMAANSQKSAAGVAVPDIPGKGRAGTGMRHGQEPAER